MSTFNALNLTPHDEQLDADEHSREIQIEESFKIFQKALIDFKAKRYDEAKEHFESLFRMDVIKPNKWGLYTYSTPTLNSLRYLAYRNRGMYFYGYLLDHEPQLSTEDIVDYTLKVVENLLEAIQHSEADTTVTSLLNKIFESYKTKRLQRWLLEYELTRQENTWIFLGRKRIGMLPQLKDILVKYDNLLTSLKEKCNINAIMRQDIFEHCDSISSTALNPILNKIKEMKTQDEMTMKQLDIFEVALKENSWEGVGKSLKELTPPIKKSVLLTKSMDPYSEVEYPIEVVKFVLSQSTTQESDGEETNEEEEERESTEKLKPMVKPKLDQSTDVKLEGKIEMAEVDNLPNKRPADAMDVTRTVQRSSKRFKDKEQDTQEDDSFKVLENFLGEFQSLLSSLDIKVPYDSSSLSTDFWQSKDDKTLPYHDLQQCLKDWSSWHTDSFIQNDFKVGSKGVSLTGENEVLQLNSLLKSNMFADRSILTSSYKDLKGYSVQDFIDSVNEQKMHFQEVRFSFLHRLLSLNDDSHERLITDYLWSSSLTKVVEWILLGIESSLYNLISSNLNKYSYFALSIYEILVNRLGDIHEEIEAKRLHGSKTSDLNNQRNHLGKKLEKWYGLLKAYVATNDQWDIYLGWAYYCYLQYSCDIVDFKLLTTLHDVEGNLKKHNGHLVVGYPNYRHIPSLSLEAINSQIRKINIIRKISIVDASEEMDGNEEMAQHIEVLQSVLLQNVYPHMECSPENKEMFTFISNSPFMLKVKLWEVLLSFYVNKNDMKNILRNYFYVLTLFTQLLSSDNYRSLSDKARQQTLLIVLSSVGNFTSKLISSLSRCNWQISDAIDHDNLNNLSKIFFFFFPILIYESMMRSDASKKPFFKKAVKSSTKMKDTIINLATVFVFFFNDEACRRIPSQQCSFTTNMIWCLHSLLGTFAFCDASESNFLKLCEKILCQIVDNDSLILLKQVLWCRYHYLIAGDNFAPEQHPTKAVEMDKGNSIPLGIYLVKLLYKGKNPLLSSGNKSNLKPVLDNIIETIGDPLTSGNQIIERNNYELSEYLETPITAQLFRTALAGKYSLPLTTPQDELQEFMDSGVFYVSSIQSLNLYRIRKKSMQARPSELDSIMAMLKTDIVYNTKRFESWYLLGKCYAYIVEDDLMWTSDKLTVIEKKSSIALTQRQSILCFIMSLTLFHFKENKLPEDEIIVQKAMEELGSGLIGGYLKPMDKLCFTWKRPETLLNLEESGRITEKKTTSCLCISNFNIEQAILLCLTKSSFYISKHPTEENISNWLTNYYIGKLFFKIDRINYSTEAFENIQRSCRIAMKASSPKDPIIEPHYSLVNMCFKSVKYGIRNPVQAMELLAFDKDFFKEDDGFWEIDDSLTIDYQIKVFYRQIVQLLKYLIASDKKRWHHRPRYRIARILFDEFGDVDGALDEMGAVMSIKSSHKNLVNIWKPDFERPGKHFVYTNQYVVFFLDILYRKGDFNSIGLVCKKIRRFGSGMAYVNRASEHAVLLYTKCVRTRLQINEKEYVERILPLLNYQVFLKTSRLLVEKFDKTKYPEMILESIQIAHQLKKGNNGIAFDGICLSIYFKYFYLPFAATLSQNNHVTHEPELEEQSSQPQKDEIIASEHSPASTNQNTPKPVIPRKRVSKKDAFDKIRALIEKIT